MRCTEGLLSAERENPPDRASLRRSGKKPALSLAERRRYNAERSRNGIHFLLLFCLACLLAWWLIFSGV